MRFQFRMTDLSLPKSLAEPGPPPDPTGLPIHESANNIQRHAALRHLTGMFQQSGSRSSLRTKLKKDFGDYASRNRLGCVEISQPLSNPAGGVVFYEPFITQLITTQEALRLPLQERHWFRPMFSRVASKMYRYHRFI